jgi:hypothetical protein
MQRRFIIYRQEAPTPPGAESELSQRSSGTPCAATPVQCQTGSVSPSAPLSSAGSLDAQPAVNQAFSEAGGTTRSFAAAGLSGAMGTPASRASSGTSGPLPAQTAVPALGHPPSHAEDDAPNCAATVPPEALGTAAADAVLQCRMAEVAEGMEEVRCQDSDSSSAISIGRVEPPAEGPTASTSQLCGMLCLWVWLHLPGDFTQGEGG